MEKLINEELERINKLILDGIKFDNENKEMISMYKTLKNHSKKVSNETI